MYPEIGVHVSFPTYVTKAISTEPVSEGTLQLPGLERSGGRDPSPFTLSQARIPDYYPRTLIAIAVADGTFEIRTLLTSLGLQHKTLARWHKISGFP